MPTISILLPVYKEPESIIKESIESILSQDYKDFELIIVLDDPLNVRLRNIVEMYSKRDSRVSVIRNSQNIGLARSLNKAISKAKGTYICRMDADDISEHDRLSTQLSYLRNNKLDLVGSGMTVIDEDGTELYPVDNLPESSDSVTKALHFNNCVPHPTWFGKKEVFLQKYRLVPLCEDYDFLVRASLHGDRIGNVPRKLVKYRMSKSSVSRTNLYKQFLYQVELTKAYAMGEVLDIDSAKIVVNQNHSRKKAEHYSHANQLFNRGLSLIRSRKYIRGLYDLARVPLISQSYFRKIIRLARAYIVK